MKREPLLPRPFLHCSFSRRFGREKSPKRNRMCANFVLSLSVNSGDRSQQPNQAICQANSISTPLSFGGVVFESVQPAAVHAALLVDAESSASDRHPLVHWD